MYDYNWDAANKMKIDDDITLKERKLINLFIEKNSITICLDVGRGSGLFSVPMSKHGIKVLSIDCDFVQLKKLKSKKRGGSIQIFIGNTNKLPIKNGFFNCIVSINVVNNPCINNILIQFNKILLMYVYLMFISLNKQICKNYLYLIWKKFRTFSKNSFDGIISFLEKEDSKVERCSGCNWMLFKMDLNSILIVTFRFFEKIFKVEHFSAITPWVFSSLKNRGAL